MWHKITYPLLNLNGYTVEGISNFIPHLLISIWYLKPRIILSINELNWLSLTFFFAYLKSQLSIIIMVFQALQLVIIVVFCVVG